MRRRVVTGRVMLAIPLALLIALVSFGQSALAVHESTNTLVLEAVDGSPAPSASGDGVVEYRGGGALDSRWTVQLRFRGLAAGARYVAVVQGRYGAAGQPRGDEFDELCAFRATPVGEGGCWWYMIQMQQLNVAQLRLGAVDGPPVVQATRNVGGPGSIRSAPNAFSAPEASPAASPVPATPVASPRSG